MQTSRHLLLGSLAVMLLLSSTSAAQVPEMLSYQGRVSVHGTNFTGDGLFKFGLLSGDVTEGRQATAVAFWGGQFIYDIQVTDEGLGYLTPPAVRIVGGGGSGATAQAFVQNGAVTSISVMTSGNGYTGTPTVEIDPPQQEMVFETIWSHDGTSANGLEPQGSVSVPVQKGLFATLLGGDGMQPISASVFEKSEVYLRVWFATDLSAPFEQLSPDHRLASVAYAMKSQGADTAHTVIDGAITADKIAANAITVDKIQPGAIGSESLAVGSVSGWQVVGSEPATAEPNRRYLMPQEGMGILTLPANPPLGTSISVTGGGTVLANTGQIISGVWCEVGKGFGASEWEGPSQVLVSDDGRTVVGYVDRKFYHPGPPVEEHPARIRILRAGVASYMEHQVPANSNGDAGPVPTGSQIIMSGDAQKFFGYFMSDAGPKLYKSDNAGLSWQEINLPLDQLFGEGAPNPNFEGIAGSKDLTTIYVHTGPNGLIRTSDAGSTWSKITNLPEGYFISPGTPIRCSQDGLIVMLAANGPTGPELFRTEDSGDTWTLLNLAEGQPVFSPPYFLLMSSDGDRVLLGGSTPTPGGNPIFSSTNGGDTFQRYLAPGITLRIAMSGDGRLLAAAAMNPIPPVATLRISRNLGESWTDTKMVVEAAPDGRISISESGSQIVIGRTYPNGIMISAADKVILGTFNSAAEFIYQGGGVWTTAQDGLQGSFAE